jgi:hypothetical protein
MLTKPVKILLFVLFALLTILGLLLIDDNLSDDSKSLLEKTKITSDDTGYFYLMGIMAAEDEDPVEVGKKIYASIKLAETKHSANSLTPLDFETYPDDKRLALPSGDFFCQYREANCFQNIINNIGSFNRHQHQVLTKRYLTYIQLPDHNQLTTPDGNEPLPPYQYLTAGSRAFLLSTFQEAQINPTHTLTTLNKHIVQLRIKLANANNLVEKMVYVSLISQSIDVMFAISKNNNHTQDLSTNPLTQHEMDLGEALKREFLWQASLYKNLNGNPHIFSETTKVPSLFTKIIFKENMTINLAAADFSAAIERSQLTAFEFGLLSQISKAEKDAPEIFFSPRNIVGSRLNAIAAPDYNNYIIRLHELNNKMLLFNSIVANKGELVDLINPYYQLSEKPEIKNGRLCLKSPIKDDSLIGCLIVNINEQAN